MIPGPVPESGMRLDRANHGGNPLRVLLSGERRTPAEEV